MEKRLLCSPWTFSECKFFPNDCKCMAEATIFLHTSTVVWNDDRYERYSQKKGWKFDIVDITESDMKGYKVCIVFISIPPIALF